MSYGSDNWAKWVLNEDESLPLLKAAWDAGIQTWDTADGYSNVLSLGVLNYREYRRS
jgi:aryl-alcohol dehydrogenase-like predicted oxidoreductase